MHVGQDVYTGRPTRETQQEPANPAKYISLGLAALALFYGIHKIRGMNGGTN